jgi:hypothetical protein
MNLSDYILENLQMKQEIDELRLSIIDAVESYERFGEISNFEGQPLIYAKVLLDLREKLK